MDINTVTLIGRLTKEPSIAVTQTGKKYLQFTLASNRDNDNADFINCVAWEKTAELIEQYCVKGSRLCVHGKIQTRSYEDSTGRTVYVTEVLVRQMQFLDNKKQEQNNSVPLDSNYDSNFRIDSDDLPFN